MSAAQGKYHIWTVGCQMNMADTQRVSGILENLGWEESPTMDGANLVVLNTCSVREQPEKRAHGQLSLLKHAKKRRADLLVAMMGCMVGNSRQVEEMKQRYPGHRSPRSRRRKRRHSRRRARPAARAASRRTRPNQAGRPR